MLRGMVCADREASGRFVVSYPFVKGNPCFVDSRQIAINRLRALECRFKMDNEFRISYNKFMQDYLDSEHMEMIRQPFPVKRGCLLSSPS